MDEYKPPLLHRYTHLGTILPNRLRPLEATPFVRETLETSDGDFIDVDRLRFQNERCVILLHGLEGSSQSTYIRGMAEMLIQQGYDVAAMNFRSCGGRPNRLVTSYHSGKTDDVAHLVNHLSDGYKELSIVGFSLGGNVALKLAGEWKINPPKAIRAVVGVSVPCDLAGSSEKMNRWQNIIYLKRFLKQLKRKAVTKAKRFAEAGLDEDQIRSARNFREFDDAYTAPAHGFKDAMDYYHQSSSIRYLNDITVPTLIINARNDTFLSMSCFPFDEAEANENLKLLTPDRGGHVGFATDERMLQTFWHEERILEFIGA